MQLKTKFWLKISLLNLCIVATLGVLMRYKIGFEFPFFDQKHLQHSHSHFAFSGWISHTLMTLMVYYLQTKTLNLQIIKYNKIIITNLICAYGMLICFIIQGYGFFSITFSTASVLVSYVFCYQYFKDLKLIEDDLLVKNWLKAALFFNILSSLGTFYLAYMMASKNVVQDLYLSSIYFYLHFQYNGWFFFASMGLFLGFLNLRKSEHPFYETFFKLFVFACIPAYLLSILWLDLPFWLYVITIIAAIIQVFAWFKFLLVLLKSKINSLEQYSPLLRYILVFVGFALSVKLILQLGSTVPIISQLAFGFRPIVIAYLHLVLLAIISLFLLFYIYSNHLIILNKNIKYGILLFSTAVILNEIVLAIQGLAAFSYIPIPYVNEILFGIAIVLLIGIGCVAYFSIKKAKNKPLL
ncbi:hypothetical protein C3L50_13135 [Flavobacterium alvei]|uniref:Uncharacterized protein n=1 Tax=Flavobacterium alvei TaxID=2080416 RepID=A0A2S5A6I8_9FLAO|nr:hypothetical protein [Flavobacterium alvei]POY38201.1 hypothetical protein C3L50_13135 [Flavobacterium alvei]HQE33298.1 hypothetical protein [Flavobacterium alvei]HQF47200.1 hypothetical protein [Flavobacterium alvei]HQK39215.1 hypothetical protein [Flavobacterium alvei]